MLREYTIKCAAKWRNANMLRNDQNVCYFPSCLGLHFACFFCCSALKIVLENCCGLVSLNMKACNLVSGPTIEQIPYKVISALQKLGAARTCLSRLHLLVFCTQFCVLECTKWLCCVEKDFMIKSRVNASHLPWLSVYRKSAMQDLHIFTCMKKCTCIWQLLDIRGRSASHTMMR